MIRQFIVLTELRLGYGSHTRCLTPAYYKLHEAGVILLLDSETPDGTVWFIDPDGFRGKTDSGEAKNLVKSGTLKELK